MTQPAKHQVPKPSRKLPQLRNPGLYSFLIFLTASLMVVALYKLGAPDAAKLAGELIALLVTGFGAKSAFSTPGKVVKTTVLTLDGNPVASVAREQPQTWPGEKVPQSTIEFQETADAAKKDQGPK